MNTDESTALRCAYIPYVALCIAWDYADTVCDIAAQMRVDKLKKPCRLLRDLRRRYDSFRQRFLPPDHLRQEARHAQAFLDGNADVLRWFNSTLTDRIRSIQPDLDPRYLYLLLAAYQAIAVVKAIKMYAADADKLLDDISGAKSAHSVIPDEALALFELIGVFIGDFPLPLSDPMLCRFAQSLYQSLSEIEFEFNPD